MKKYLSFIIIFVCSFLMITNKVNAANYSFIDGKLNNSNFANAIHNLINDLQNESGNIYVTYRNYNNTDGVLVSRSHNRYIYNYCDNFWRCCSSSDFSNIAWYRFDSSTNSLVLDSSYPYSTDRQTDFSQYLWSNTNIIFDDSYLGNYNTFCTNNISDSNNLANKISSYDDSQFYSYDSNRWYNLYPNSPVPQVLRAKFPSWFTASDYTYTINYYFDNVLDSSKTIIDIKPPNTILTQSMYDEYTTNIYSLADNYTFTLSENNMTFNVYYVSSVPYTINYYFDNVLDSSKTINGTGTLGSHIINFDNYTDEDTTLADEYDFVLHEDNNIFNVYYILAQYSTYKVEYYFDGLLDNSKTEYFSARVGDIIDEFTDYSSNIWSLVEDDYTLEIQENSDLNYIRIFYISPLYGTANQPIDTSTSLLFLPFSFQDIRDMFPSIHWDNFSQFQQLAITLAFNILFILLIIFIIYIFMKIMYKVLQFIV